MSFEMNGRQVFGERIERFLHAKCRTFGLGSIPRPTAKQTQDFELGNCAELRHLPLSLLGIGLDAITAEIAAHKSPQKLLALGVLSPDQLDRICAQQSSTEFLIFRQARSN